MNDFEQDLARTNHLLSDVAVFMYEVVQAWADEQLEWLDSLPSVQPITEDTLKELSEQYQGQQLQNIIDWEEEQLAWLDSLPEFDPLHELPEPDRHGLPPAGTPLDILPPPYNRHDWWKYTILKEVGEDVSQAYFQSQDYKELESQVFEFVPSFDNYLTMFKRFDDTLTLTISDGFKGIGTKGITATQMRGIISHSLNRADRFEFEGQVYPFWYLNTMEDVDGDDPRIKRFKDYSLFDHMTVQLVHVMFMNDGQDIDMENQRVFINIFISKMIELAVKDFNTGYESAHAGGYDIDLNIREQEEVVKAVLDKDI